MGLLLSRAFINWSSLGQGHDDNILSDRLFRAIRNRRTPSTSTACIQELIDQGANVNRQNDDGNSPLDCACMKSDIHCMRLLIQNGATVDVSGRSPLHYLTTFRGNIVRANYIECVELLLQHGANVNVCDFSNITPLHWAVDYNKLECVQLFLQHGANVNVFDSNNKTPLHCAVRNNNIEFVKLLLQHDANTNVFDSNNITPLYCAAGNNNTQCVKLLLQYWANTNVFDSNNTTPLVWTVLNNNIDCVKLLLQHGADTNVRAYNSIPLLLLSVCSDNIECVEVLLKHGAKTNLCGIDNITPLHIAALKNNIECVKLLLKHGAKIDLLDNNQNTALNLAGRCCHLEIIKILLEYNANETNRNLRGQTPLMQAAIEASRSTTMCTVACLELLIQASGQFDLRNKHGKLIPDIACDSKLSKMLLPYCVHPRSLQVLCRHKIRSSLYDHFLPEAVSSLNLTKKLKQFVLLQC